jgi:ferredoxin
MSVAPEIHATRCVRYRFRYSECRTCEQACPHDAIRLSDEGAAIAGEKCRGCGLCVSACRTETYTTASLAPLALIEQARGRGTLAIACTPSGAEADAQVPCLGALGPALLAYLVRHGTELSLIGSDHCAHCSHGARGGEQLAANLDAVESLRAGDLLGTWAAITLPQRTRGGSTQGDERRAGRRQFFRRVASAGAARSAAQQTRAAIPLRAIRAARVVPSAQRDLLQLLGLAEAGAPLPTHPALPVADLRLEAGCTGCEACARACPTGALQVREHGTAWALGYEAGLCVACAVCVETCQPRLLHLQEAVPARNFTKRDALALHGMPKRRCTRCDRSYMARTDSALCEVCAGDVQDFDAIFG